MPELIHQVVGEQRPHQLAAADHVQVAAILLLQREHGLGEVALEHGGVLPLQRLDGRP